MSSLLLPIVLACAAAPQARDAGVAEGELAAILARLSAPELATREDAQLRLAGVADEERVPALAAFLRGADEEARARVSAALASRAVLLPLVAVLANDADARVARAGGEALELATLAAAQGAALPSLARELEWLTRSGSGSVRVEGALLAAPAEDLLPILLAAGGQGLELAFDPECDPGSRAALPAGEGDLWRWLSALGQVRGIAHRLHRVDGGRALLVVGGGLPSGDEPEQAAQVRQADFLARSVRASLDADPVRRRVGCLALAGSGWSAAQAWIERRASLGEEVAVEAVARTGWARGALRGLESPAASAALRRLLAQAGAAGDLARGAPLAAACGAASSECAWPMPAESRSERLLQLVEALHARRACPFARDADESIPPLLMGLLRPDSDLTEVLWSWRVAARHEVALPPRVAELHGARLAAALVAADEAQHWLELARGTGRLLPEGLDPDGVPPELILAARCETGQVDAARACLGRLVTISPLAAARAWRAGVLRLSTRGASHAREVLQDGTWIADTDLRTSFLELVGLRAVEARTLPDLEPARLDHLAAAPEGAAARSAWLAGWNSSRAAQRGQLERADAIVRALQAAGADGAAWNYVEAVRAKLGEGASWPDARFPAPMRVVVQVGWFDPVPGRSLGGS